MDEALKRAGWLLIVVFAVSYFTFLSSDYVFKPRTATSSPVIIRDIMRKDEHRLSGKVIVQSTCDQISLVTENLGNNIYKLKITTWPEPSIKCFKAPVERVFDTVIFAPNTGVHFVATLDNKELPVAIYPTMSTQ